MRILLVEDQPALAAMTLQVLRDLHGHDVHHAPDGPAALVLAPRVNPDLALIDLGLPGMDGYEVARRLRGTDRDRGPVLVALSGYAQADDRDRAKAAGFDHHFAKPMDFEVLDSLKAGSR